MNGTGEFSIGHYVWPGTSKLMEEMGELQQVLGKLLGIHGDAVKHWSGDLRAKMIEELGDVLAASEFFAAENMTPEERRSIHKRAEEKLALFRKWHTEGIATRQYYGDPEADPWKTARQAKSSTSSTDPLEEARELVRKHSDSDETEAVAAAANALAAAERRGRKPVDAHMKLQAQLADRTAAHQGSCRRVADLTIRLEAAELLIGRQRADIAERDGKVARLEEQARAMTHRHDEFTAMPDFVSVTEAQDAADKYRREYDAATETP